MLPAHSSRKVLKNMPNGRSMRYFAPPPSMGLDVPQRAPAQVGGNHVTTAQPGCIHKGSVSSTLATTVNKNKLGGGVVARRSCSCKEQQVGENNTIRRILYSFQRQHGVCPFPPLFPPWSSAKPTIESWMPIVPKEFQVPDGVPRLGNLNSLRSIPTVPPALALVS